MSEVATIGENAESLVSQVGDLSDDNLVALLAEEQATDKPRKTVVEAITTEQKRRVDEAAAAAKDPQTGEAKLEISDLLENANLLTGYSPYLLAGALHGENGPITVSAAKKKADAFAKKEIQPDEAAEEAEA